MDLKQLLAQGTISGKEGTLRMGQNIISQLAGG